MVHGRQSAHPGAVAAPLCSVCAPAQKERDVRAAAAAAERAGPKPRHGCPVCGRDCLKASALQKHLRVHSGERPFQCPVCRKSFVQHVHMTEHLRIHTGEKPYTCPLCGRSFTFSSALRRHQRLHADTRPFQCAVCHKSFKQRSSLKGHQLVHTGVRFPCPVCSKSFSRPLELNYHVGTHSSARPYYCHTLTSVLFHICPPDLPPNRGKVTPGADGFI
uniref:C2H2-type domain-containing protein n=1 Tax=Gadus morhua TaxID=8049 RepID=A0A8C5FRM5_GADMO